MKQVYELVVSIINWERWRLISSTSGCSRGSNFQFIRNDYRIVYLSIEVCDKGHD